MVELTGSILTIKNGTRYLFAPPTLEKELRETKIF
jgi:hypothetical protein